MYINHICKFYIVTFSSGLADFDEEEEHKEANSLIHAATPAYMDIGKTVSVN